MSIFLILVVDDDDRRVRSLVRRWLQRTHGRRARGVNLQFGLSGTLRKRCRSEQALCCSWAWGALRVPAPGPSSTSSPPSPAAFSSEFLLVEANNVTLQDLKRLLRAESLQIAQLLWCQVREYGWVQDKGVLM